MDNNNPKPQQNQLAIEINPQTTKVSYSNLAIISHSRSEFVLDFAKDGDSLKAIPLNATDIRLEGCVHTLKRVYRKRSAEAFLRILCESDAVLERAHNWLK